MSKPYAFYEFFAGGGMARLGLGDRWRCLFANDIDRHKAAAYRANFGDSDFHEGDIARLTPADLPGAADLAWASFPCQDLSLAGGRKGLAGGRSGAFFAFWDLMERLAAEGRRPPLLVLENVAGLMTSNGGADLDALFRLLTGAGYGIAALLADAAWATPQSRPRLFIIADALGRLSGGGPEDALHPAALQDSVRRLPEAARRRFVWTAPPRPPKRNADLIDIVEAEPQGVCWNTAQKSARLLARMAPRHAEAVSVRRAAGGRHIGAVYNRIRIENGERRHRAEVRFDGLAGCLRTPAGGSSRQTLLFIEDGAVRSRLLSPREAARLMGLPETYRLPQSTTQAFRLCGDGVSVPIVRWLAETVLEPALNAPAIAAE